MACWSAAVLLLDDSTGGIPLVFQREGPRLIGRLEQVAMPGVLGWTGDLSRIVAEYDDTFVSGSCVIQRFAGMAYILASLSIQAHEACVVEASWSIGRPSAEAMVLTVCEGNCLPENLNAQIELPCIVVRQAGDFFTCRVRLIMTELSVSGPSPAPARRPGFRKDCGSPRFRASYDSN